MSTERPLQTTSFPAAADEEEQVKLRFPDPHTTLDQDEEWCELLEPDGQWRRIRFHDYDEVYKVPGLYEALFYRTLRCNSPQVIANMLSEVLADHNEPMEKLRVFDVGAGNGMVGEQMFSGGVAESVGIDIIPEARDAALRDRPYVYSDYVVADLTDMDEADEKLVRNHRLNALTTVAALGFGDIPPAAFVKALDLVETPAWLAFNIKEDFLYDSGEGDFSALIEYLRAAKIIRIESFKRYQHRLSTSGEPLYYVAVVARKLADVPDDCYARFEAAS
jgi:hypothetical protein